MTKLGFHQPLTRLHVFVKNEANCLWYFLEDSQKRYIQESALTGVLKSFEVKEAATSFGNELKADFEVVADRRYVLRSGVDTAFTKGMLMAIAALSDEKLKRPITIELKPGEEKGNVLVSARDPETFEFVRTGSWENVDWTVLMNRALARLGGSQPLPQPQPQGLLPQHNSLVKSVRTVTGHTPDQIVGWCREHEAARPDQLSSELCDQLIESLCVGWGMQFFPDEQHAAASFRNHVQSEIAAGAGKGDAIASWLEEARALPLSR